MHSNYNKITLDKVPVILNGEKLFINPIVISDSELIKENDTKKLVAIYNNSYRLASFFKHDDAYYNYKEYIDDLPLELTSIRFNLSNDNTLNKTKVTTKVKEYFNFDRVELIYDKICSRALDLASTNKYSIEEAFSIASRELLDNKDLDLAAYYIIAMLNNIDFVDLYYNLYVYLVDNLLDKNKIIDILNNSDLDRSRYIVISGAALVLNGIKSATSDIDIHVDRDYLEELKTRKDAKIIDDNLIKINSIMDIGTKYKPSKILVIDNINVASIDDIAKLKKELDRPKDRYDLELINKHIK